MNCLKGYWKNSFPVNLALTELLQEIFTCPIPVVYNAFIGEIENQRSENNRNSLFYECISELFYRNESVIRQLSDSKTISLVQKLRLSSLQDSFQWGNSEMRELEREKERLDFAQNYVLLEEFIKEVVAIMQGHALNFYDCLLFEEVEH